MKTSLLGESTMKQVLLVISETGFQEHEYSETKKVLEDAGIKVVTTSDDPKEAIGHAGTKQKIEVQLDQINPREYDGIFLIGGPGALDHLNIPEVHKVLSEFFALNKPYGAICISTLILAQAELLQNKKATCWNKNEKAQAVLEAHGAEFVDEHVVTDGNVVTANGPDAATDFGKAILEVI